MKVKSLSRVRLFATPWTAASQALPSMGFSRQERVLEWGVSANDCCNFRLEYLHHDGLSRGGEGHDLLLVSLVTSESTRGQLLL